MMKGWIEKHYTYQLNFEIVKFILRAFLIDKNDSY